MNTKISPDRACQVPYRLHADDYKVLKKLLADDGLTFQGMVKICVDAYMQGNPLVLKLLKQHAEMSSVPQDVLDRYVLSQRERQALLEAIDKEEDQKPIGSED